MSQDAGSCVDQLIAAHTLVHRLPFLKLGRVQPACSIRRHSIHLASWLFHYGVSQNSNNIFETFPPFSTKSVQEAQAADFGRFLCSLKQLQVAIIFIFIIKGNVGITWELRWKAPRVGVATLEGFLGGDCLKFFRRIQNLRITPSKLLKSCAMWHLLRHALRSQFLLINRLSPQIPPYVS